MSYRLAGAPDPETVPIRTVRRSRGSYGLTKHEIAVAKMLANGYVGKQIGQALGITPSSVASVTERIRIRLDAATTTQAVVMLAKAGLV